jgi:hypothetical protein
MTADSSDLMGKKTNKGRPARGEIMMLLNPAVDMLAMKSPK